MLDDLRKAKYYLDREIARLTSHTEHERTVQDETVPTPFSGLIAAAQRVLDAVENQVPDTYQCFSAPKKYFLYLRIATNLAREFLHTSKENLR